MKKLLAALSITLLSGATCPASAGSVPKVVTSIKPIHALVAGVMEGVGEATLILHGAGSPHSYSMRPSQAGMLADAEIVFWVGPDLETFLTKPLETLAEGAKKIALAETDGLTLVEMREGGAFESHSHGGHDHGGDHSGHDDKNEDSHHDHSHDDGHHHDMHLWLDPQNAQIMVEVVAATLSDADPENAGTYAANATGLKERIAALETRLAEELASVKGRPFIVFHDAYQYFENRFGLAAAGSITVSPEALPGAQRIEEIRGKISEVNAACVFSEPQFEPKLVEIAIEGTDARAGVLDPLGAALEDGPELYFELLEAMAASLKECLSREN